MIQFWWQYVRKECRGPIEAAIRSVSNVHACEMLVTSAVSALDFVARPDLKALVIEAGLKSGSLSPTSPDEVKLYNHWARVHGRDTWPSTVPLSSRRVEVVH